MRAGNRESMDANIEMEGEEDRFHGFSGSDRAIPGGAQGL
jgi:hypothetical protein